MKAKEWREFTTEELQHKLEELYQQLFNLRTQKVLGQLENPHKIKEVKKDIARIKTILRERELKVR
ncbi:50S ribosomal protein L29 [Candidatus Calescamantes bacterium]|nr:50S ribosomal protein L29 [Candidatus Calescamantes bacterium]